MPITVQPVEVADASALGPVMMYARWESPHWQAIWDPSVTIEQITSDCVIRLPWNLVKNRKDVRHEKAVDEHDEVVSYIRWILPPHLAEEATPFWPEAQVADVDESQRKKFQEQSANTLDNGKMKGSRTDLMAYQSQPLEDADERIMKNGPYLTLDYLTTAPDHQRKGAGTALLRSGLKVADAYGLKTYVMAEPPSLKLYYDHGFDLIEKTSVDYSKFGGLEETAHYFMTRQPKAAKA